MSQYDFGTIDAGTKSGAALAGDLNAFRDALNSAHKGGAAPTYAVPGLHWLDDTGDPLWLLKVYDGTNWIAVTAIDTTANVAVPVSVGPKQNYPRAGGTADALTLTPPIPLLGYVDHDVATFEASADNSGAVTLNVSGAGARAVRKIVAGADVSLVAGDIRAGQRYFLSYDAAANSAAGAWILVNPSVDYWQGKAIGEPFALWDHMTGLPVPPQGHFIKLTAGLTGAGGYNNGALATESVTGSFPFITATAKISDVASPIYDWTVHLINTESRFLRPSAPSGATEDFALQGHYHRSYEGPSETSGNSGSTGQYPATRVSGGNARWNSAAVENNTVVRGVSNDATYGTALVSNETRPRNIRATYYMRIR